MSPSIGTFNVWGLPEPFTEDLSARMSALAARLLGLDLDVLLIQEAWTDEVRATLREGGLRAGFEVAEAAEAPGGGLMVLSRRPIRSSRFERFGFRGDPERITKGEFFGGKGFQTVTVDEEDGGRLSIVNTHLHARYRRARPRLNSAVRTAQLLQLVGAVDRLEGAAILGGDFNCTPGDPEYRIFVELTGAREVGSPAGSHPTISRANYYKRGREDPDKRVDHLFVRAAGRGWEASEQRLLFAEPVRIRGGARSLSDHFGFRARIRIDRLAPELAAREALQTARPSPETLDLARRLLGEGRAEVNRRERKHFWHAGAWVGTAALAAGLRRRSPIDRRRFLRGTAGLIAGLSLAPAFGYTTLARLDSDYKREAFDQAQAVLSDLHSASDRSA